MTIIQMLCFGGGGISLGIGLVLAVLVTLSERYTEPDGIEGCLSTIIVPPFLLFGTYLIVRGILA